MSKISRFLPVPLVGFLLHAPVAVHAKPKSASVAAPTLGKNLLRNPGAEDEPVDNVVPGWQRVDGATWDNDDAFDAAAWGKVSGEWDYGLVGAPHGGERYFRLGFEHGKQRTVTQTIDVTTLAKAIDEGKLSLAAAADLGGFVGGDSTITLAASLLDGGGKELASVETPQVDLTKLPKPQKGGASLTHESASVAVPAGTRKIVARLRTSALGTSNSYLGLADNLSLVMTRKP